MGRLPVHLLDCSKSMTGFATDSVNLGRMMLVDPIRRVHRHQVKQDRSGGVFQPASAADADSYDSPRHRTGRCAASQGMPPQGRRLLGQQRQLAPNRGLTRLRLREEDQR